LYRSQKRSGKTQPRLTRLFLRTRATVSRPQPKERAMARWESRSPNAFSMSASFSRLNFRLLPSGAQALWQALQRRRWLPARVKPWRTTPSGRWQCGHT
jgi:hypothetical protein